MYEFSRALFRRVEPWIEPSSTDIEARRTVLGAAERAVERLFDEPRAAPRISRALFREIRFLFPLGRKADLCQVIETAIRTVAANAELRAASRIEFDGSAQHCSSFTRRGTQCRRAPLANGWCPSHQHLVERV